MRLSIRLSKPNAPAWRLFPNRWDLIVLPLVMGAIALAAAGLHQTMAPLASLKIQTISLHPNHLPEYALRTTLRMLAAMVASLLFTFAYGALASKSRRAEKILVPLLDILQSVPVLGYISFTVTFFLTLFPGRVAGAECAAIFAIFTAQAWNMTFSFYQSLRTVPRDLEEVSRSFHLTGWQRFWKLEVPFSMPGLVWNMMMSMSGSWFFIVASEAITVGNTEISLPGIGAYLAQAVVQRDLNAVGWVVLTMMVVIFIYDQLLFRPLIAWADKFRLETTAGAATESWVLDLVQRTRLIRRLLVPLGWIMGVVARLPLGFPQLSVVKTTAATRRVTSKLVDAFWILLFAVSALYVIWQVLAYTRTTLNWDDVRQVLGLGALTLLRVTLLIVLASVIWVPIGVLIGNRPRLAEKVQPIVQFMAAFPANLLFPIFVVLLVRFKLNADIWLSPLIILGAQWYILFNVIAGTMAYPNDFKEAAANFQIRGWQWWRQVMLPGIFPYYVTGAITASGGAWNASIVSEAVAWGNTKIVSHGLGAYIAEMTEAGDYPHILLGIAVMSLFVTLFNRLLWRPMYRYAENKLRLD